MGVPKPVDTMALEPGKLSPRSSSAHFFLPLDSALHAIPTLHPEGPLLSPWLPLRNNQPFLLEGSTAQSVEGRSRH